MMRVAALVVLLLLARSLDACLCAGPGGWRTPADAKVLLRADAVFEGVVIARRMELAQEDGGFFPVPEYEFRVTRAWKGVSSPTVRLLGGFDNCASVFPKGVKYLVTASPHRNRPGRLSSSKCGPTMPVADAAAYLAVLGRPAVAFAGGNERRSATMERLRSLAVGGLSVFANLLWHGNQRWPWVWVRWPTALLAISVVAALVVAAFRVRGRRRTVVLVIVSILLSVASLLSAGLDLYRDSWLSRYLE